MKNKSLFWEFWTATSEKPSVIYGTIHLGIEDCLTYWDRVCSLIDVYDHIYTESAIDQQSIAFVQPFSLLESGVNVHDYVSVRRWRKMRSVFQKYAHIDIDMYRMMRPLFIMSQIQCKLIDADEVTPLDFKIWQYAEASDKRVVGIETPQEQVQILRTLDLPQQYKQLVRMSKGISNTRQKLTKIVRAYVNQDIHQLYKLSKGSLGKDRSALIGDRNTIMAERLLNIHNDKPSFFSFGAGHMAGGNGVLRLLKQAGASIKPI